MQHVSELLAKALEVASKTQNQSDFGAIDKYYFACGLWLRYSPVPTRPILNTAWFEAGILTETSIFLTVHGFYEQACAILRMQLDGFLTRLYWDTLDKHMELEGFSIENRLSNNYWEWESGKSESYPQLNDKVFPVLRREKYFQSFDSRYDLTNEIVHENRLLNKFIHGRPSTRHHPEATRSSRLNTQFDQRQFDFWYMHFKTIYELMTTVSILLYPTYLDCLHRDEFILLELVKLNRIIDVLEAQL